MIRRLLATAFPFHIALNRRMEVTALGPSMAKLAGRLGLSLEPGAPLAEVCFIKTPPVAVDYDAVLEQADTVLFLSDREERITLKGQVAALAPEVSGPESALEAGDGDTAMVFLCTPVLANLEETERLGLTLRDFALHDSTLDYLILLQTQTNVLNDTREMASLLLQESKIRRRTQDALRKANLDLEGRIRERTEALSASNRQLETSVAQLRKRNLEMASLNAIGERLHGCQSVREAFPIIHEGIDALFPGSSGRLACYDEEQDVFRAGIEWGGEHPCPPVFRAGQCTALREDRILFHDGQCGEVCAKCASTPGEGAMCRPLKVADQTLGLLHFRYPLQSLDGDDWHDREWLEGRTMLITTLSEHMGLALSNLRMRERLEGQAIRDPLTRLFNRRHMEAFLEREMARALRTGSQLGLILLDLDHFKRLNDTHGHLAGDEVLVQLAGLLNAHVRKGDIACRYGGEEFLLILCGAGPENVTQRAEELRAAAAATTWTGPDGANLGPVTISAGVCSFPSAGGGLPEILHAADAALYEAKRRGRNRVVAWERENPKE